MLAVFDGTAELRKAPCSHVFLSYKGCGHLWWSAWRASSSGVPSRKTGAPPPQFPLASQMHSFWWWELQSTCWHSFALIFLPANLLLMGRGVLVLSLAGEGSHLCRNWIDCLLSAKSGERLRKSLLHLDKVLLSCCRYKIPTFQIGNECL